MADVLIVDDNPDIGELLELLLLSEGHSVRVAHDGLRGLQELDRRLPDLVLLDVDMPVLDGPGLAYRMLVENCGKETIPIILVSATFDLPDVARKVGTPYTLAKPFDAEALLRLLGRVLVERCPPTPTIALDGATRR
jgi:CheY-like chemotaxis protein